MKHIKRLLIKKQIIILCSLLNMKKQRSPMCFIFVFIPYFIGVILSKSCYQSEAGFPLMGGMGHGGHPSHPMVFFETPPSKPMPPPMGCPPSPTEKQSPPLKNETPFQKMIPRKKYPKNRKLPFAKNSTNT